MMIKVKACDLVGRSLVTNIIKSSKTSAFNVVDTVVRYQKMLFPSHVDKITFRRVKCKVIIIKLVDERFERRKLALDVCVFFKKF